VYSVGFSITALPCIDSREQAHAIAVQQQSDAVLLTIDAESQRSELDLLLGEVTRSVVHPRRNPYGPMSIMYVLKSVYASPSATVPQLMTALRIAQAGRQACEAAKFNNRFDDDVRQRTLAVILNNAAGIALRLAHEVPVRRTRMLQLSKYLHEQSLLTFFFPGTVRGALTCANHLEDVHWAKSLLRRFVECEGLDRRRWPKGILADLEDPTEWAFLKRHKFWNLLDERASVFTATVHTV
jgi:hypothetical protein